MNRRSFRWINRIFSLSKNSRSRHYSGARRFVPNLEHLEDRVTPSAVSWTGNAGTLNWGDMNNWSNNAVPGSGDDVTISKAGVGTITIGAGTSYAVHSLTDTTAVLSIVLGASLSLAPVTASSTFGQSVTVQSGGALTVGAGASVLITSSATITDNGTLTVGAGTAMVAQEAFGSTEGIVVNGAMNVTGAYFTRSRYDTRTICEHNI